MALASGPVRGASGMGGKPLGSRVRRTPAIGALFPVGARRTIGRLLLHPVGRAVQTHISPVTWGDGPQAAAAWSALQSCSLPGTLILASLAFPPTTVHWLGYASSLYGVPLPHLPLRRARCNVSSLVLGLPLSLARYWGRVRPSAGISP